MALLPSIIVHNRKDYLCELQQGFDVFCGDAVEHELREGGHYGRLAALAVGAAEGQRQRHGVRDLHTGENACFLNAIFKARNSSFKSKLSELLKLLTLFTI